ncbi:helix-turn-helix transcriptional regulator [Streptomyces subrutilus]|uniref:helix-turn-helix transcriptional regulator n=1 Tax=Streptomyces subrutilus TaxID=36818 RepID=UPI002E140AFC|nr:LuxR C-terminal-related transcriptional regulator [Streptomyces subrutilus]
MTADSGTAAALAQAELQLDLHGSLLVAGPAGIGKSALLDRIAHRAAAAGATVLRLAPHPADRHVPYAALADLLQLLDPHPAPGPSAGHLLPGPQRAALDAVARRIAAPPGGPDPLAVRLGTTALLRAAGPRPLLVLDDAPHTDPASAAVLTALPGARLLAAGAHTPAFLDGAPVLTLGPAAPEETAALLAAQGLPSRLAARIHRAGGGNPRMTLEIGRAVAALPRPPHPLDELPLPEPVAAMALRRLVPLPPQVTAVLLTAALADRPTPALLRRAAARDVEEELAAAALAGITHPAERVDEELRFTADVLRTALVRDSTWADRCAAHRALGRTVTDPVEAARHRALACDDIDAALAAGLEAAAAAARARGERGKAAELALLAARRTPPTAPADAVRRFGAAAADAGRAGRLDLARRAAAEVLEHSGDPGERVPALLAVIDASGQALDEMDEVFARAAAEAAAAPRLLAAVELRLAWKANLCDGDPVRALGAATRAAALAERAGAEDDAAAALTMRARLERLLGDPAAGATLARALARHPAPVAGLRNTPEFLRTRHQFFDDELDEARSGLLALLPRAERSGDAEDQVEILRSLAETEARAGRCPAALRYAERARALTAAADASPGPAWYTAALAEAAGGTFARAACARRGARASEEEHDVVFLARSLHALGTVLLVTGRAGEAVDALTRVRDLERDQRVADPSVLRWHDDLAEALAAAGRPREALALLDATEPAARTPGRGGVGAALQRARAVALGGERAVPLLEASAAAFAGAGLRLEEGRTLWLLARARLRQRRRAGARAALTEAAGLFAACRAAPWQGLVADALARLDARPGEAALTAAESRLAALVAAGTSNREAAARLYVSAKTVETMLTRIYRKLGVTSRAQLAALRPTP